MPKASHPQPGQLALFEEIAAQEPAGGEPAQRAAAGDEAGLAIPAGEPDVPEPRSAAPARGGPRSPVTPRVPPSPTVTLDEVIPDYLAALAALGRSQHTLKSFALDLRLLRGHLGNRAVGSIELGQLRQFIAWVRLSRENSANSLRRKVATLKNFFTYLYEEGYVTANPADALPYPDAYIALPEFLEEDAAARLVAATEDNPFWRALVLLLLDTGLKRDEALALRVADVHLEPAPADGSYLVVRETDAAKRLRSRKLPISARLRDALDAYYASTPRGSGESRVFDVSVRGINFVVETCGSRAGIVTSKPRLTPQVLRETFAVTQMRARVREERRCQAEGWNPEALQLLALRHDAELLDLLGLKDDPDTAQKYRQLVKVWETHESTGR
jgi:site-specific recombinase XerD